MSLTRRTFLASLAGSVALGAVAALLVPLAGRAAGSDVAVWASPTCGCCGGWVEHMRDAGFTVTVHLTEDLAPVKAKSGVPDGLQSCHTAVVGGYVVEGHVPAADVRRLLAERPAARGLSVPGMPQSAPGMDNPGQPYEVMLFGRGEPTVYARH
jgi:hypothetical protein